MDRCILVATDGQPQSMGALRCGRDLALKLRLPLEVVSVCEPTAVFGYEAADLVAGVMQEMATAASNIRRGQVLAQLAAAGVDGDPPIRIEIGAAAATIGRVAFETGARSIVIGRGRHTTVERMIGDDTGLRLMQSAQVPVVSAPVEYGELPTRVLAAVDFTSYSLDAAQSAATLLPIGAELHVVYVSADHFSVDLRSWREEEWMRAMSEETAGKLDAVVAKLSRAHPGLIIRAHVVEGRPVQAILRLAEDLEVDMLAAGTSGYGFLGRLLMGSVATQLVRRARCMTLVAAPRGVVPAADHWVPDTRRSRVALAGVGVVVSRGD